MIMKMFRRLSLDSEENGMANLESVGSTGIVFCRVLESGLKASAKRVLSGSLNNAREQRGPSKDNYICTATDQT